MNIDPRESLIYAATNFYQKGWMVGTAGNLSARLPDNSFWITASGRPKGELSQQDFVRVDINGQVLEKLNPHFRPSAETSIHQVIYQCFPEAKACYHVHSIEANLVSNFTEGNGLLLPSLEMLKGLGIWEENPWVEMPLFGNHLEVKKIADEISDRFGDSPPKIPALLIRNHGVTVWANSTESAYHYIELVEYIFRYMMAARQVSF
ncbi:methylthioribulose 1-phosphate dehydratase [Hydrocoleum sp. CS-953]|uniref:methylthioribulose 1-phosphate dehydratase n=1 Tax=Microcoleaceae TaxID=1892252 RepID=UPI000B9BA8BD|nr:methylthioribulose 1-phosphate dehydratase [Hydrocoleum sp. CS-953]OZH55003.1 methylthioribulose-1-phosphate dehydratase [Hydrocoleum sp. CS-953]